MCVIDAEDGTVEEFPQEPYSNFLQPSWSSSPQELVVTLSDPEHSGAQVAILNTGSGRLRMLTAVVGEEQPRVEPRRQELRFRHR